MLSNVSLPMQEFEPCSLQYCILHTKNVGGGVEIGIIRKNVWLFLYVVGHSTTKSRRQEMGNPRYAILQRGLH